MITYKQKARFNVRDEHGQAFRQYRAERFDDVQSWIAAASEPVERMNNSSSGKPPSNYWDAGLGMTEAAELIAQGWSEGAAKVAHVAGIQAAGGEAEAVTLTAAPFGFYGDAQAAMMGDAEPYTAIDYAPEQKPVLTLAVDLSVSANVQADDFIKRGAGLLTAINALELAGVRVDLFAVVDSVDGDSGRRCTTAVKVKHADQDVNLPTLAAIVAHPAAFRRIGFAHIERLAPANYSRSYGQVVDNMHPVVKRHLFPSEQVVCIPSIVNEPQQATLETLEHIKKAEVLSPEILDAIADQLR